MHRVMSSLTTLCVLAVGVSALAQPKARRRSRVTPPPGHSKKMPPPPPSNERLCNSRRSVLAQEQRRLDASRASLAGVEAELDELKRRMADLTRRQSDFRRQIAAYERRVQTVKQAYDKECTQSESCGQYETLTTELESQANDVEKEMTAVRADISASRIEVDSLRREIDPQRREYEKLRCNDLVAGATAQSTIDRCASIFSQWNRLQARLNQQNSRLSALKSRYQQLIVELRNIESRANSYESYMARNCSRSPKLAIVRGYGGVRQRAEALGKELDQLIGEVGKLRGIQITVSPR